jgi:prepilin-type N-terminal cleavage/methylation domain-containing protein
MKRLKREDGFSLVEVVVASALMGVTALIFNRMTQTQFETVKTVQASSEIVSLVTNIRTILADTDNCQETFVRNPANAGAAYSMNQGALSDPMSLRMVLPTTGSIVDKFTANSDTAAAPKYGNGNIRIVSYSLEDSDPDVGIAASETTGTTHLLINFYRGKGTLGKEQVTKKITLNVQRASPTNNSIVSCNTSSEGVGVGIAVCTAFMGTYVQDTPERCDLPGWRDLTLPANNAANRAVSENYMKDSLLLGDAAVSTLSIGDDPANDDVIFNSTVDINGPSTFNDNATIADGSELVMASDKRLKTDIRPMEPLLSSIKLLEPVRYKWRRNDKESLGFIAQDLYHIFPTLVSTNEKSGLMSVNYPFLTAIALKGIQEVDSNVSHLQDEIKTLRKENQYLRDELELIKKSLLNLNKKLTK